MRMLPVAFVTTLALACARPTPAAAPLTSSGSADMEAAREAMMQADRDFAAATAARGIDGWMAFWTEDAAKVSFNRGPLVGLDAIRANDTKQFSDSAFRLAWQPTEAVSYRGAALGYTKGRWEASRKGSDGRWTVGGRGNYLTVWRKEADGTWKVILDVGTQDPPEAKS